MSFSVSKLVKSLESLPAKEREAKETQLLADFARHAAFNRPLGHAGFSKLFAVPPGLEELSLAADPDVVSITTEEEFERAMMNPTQPLLFIRSGTTVPEAVLHYLLEQSLDVKTVFVARAQ